MAELVLSREAPALDEQAVPLVRQSALEHIARLIQQLRTLLPSRRAGDDLARRSDVQLSDIGLTRPEVARSISRLYAE